MSHTITRGEDLAVLRPSDAAPAGQPATSRRRAALRVALLAMTAAMLTVGIVTVWTGPEGSADNPSGLMAQTGAERGNARVGSGASQPDTDAQAPPRGSVEAATAADPARAAAKPAPLVELGERRADLRRQRASIGAGREAPARPAAPRPHGPREAPGSPQVVRPAPPVFATSPLLDVADQRAGRNLRVMSVTAPTQGGIVVVYTDNNGTTGRVLGERVLDAGHDGPTTVALRARPANTASLLVVLHGLRTADPDATPKAGAPVIDGGRVVRARITLSAK